MVAGTGERKLSSKRLIKVRSFIPRCHMLTCITSWYLVLTNLVAIIEKKSDHVGRNDPAHYEGTEIVHKLLELIYCRTITKSKHLATKIGGDIPSHLRKLQIDMVKKWKHKGSSI